MADIDISGIESINIERECDEDGSILLKIESEDGTTITINCGRFHDDACNLKNLLSSVAHEADTMVTDWEDRPEEEDGYVGSDRGRYFVRLSSQWWQDGGFRSHSDRIVREGYPTLDIAMYELAAAMTATGYFPNTWEEGERGGYDDIGNAVRAFHDEEGGTDLKPLGGVEYEDDAEVLVNGMSAYVVKDYGTMGIVYVYSGDDTRRHAERDDVDPYVEQDDEEDDPHPVRTTGADELPNDREDEVDA